MFLAISQFTIYISIILHSINVRTGRWTLILKLSDQILWCDNIVATAVGTFKKYEHNVVFDQ